MPVELRYTSTQPNKTVSFDFGTDSSVLSYVVGIAYWQFTYESSDHHVKTLALGITANLADTHTVTAKVTGTLSDDSGNNISNSNSEVIVCCLAIVDSADSNLTLAAANSIANQGTSNQIALPGSSLSISSAFLAGFNLAYSSGDHHVHSFLTSAGFTQNGSVGEITAQAAMSDSSGNSVNTATINGGLVAATPIESGLVAQSKVNLQTTDTVDVEFSKSISAAVVLLQDVDMQFSGDHHIKTIGGGTTGWTLRSTGVTLDNARAFMSDASGNNQVDSASSVSVVVVAVPSES